jgi:hypothetical protein
MPEAMAHLWFVGMAICGLLGWKFGFCWDGIFVVCWDGIWDGGGLV